MHMDTVNTAEKTVSTHVTYYGSCTVPQHNMLVSLTQGKTKNIKFQTRWIDGGFEVGIFRETETKIKCKKERLWKYPLSQEIPTLVLRGCRDAYLITGLDDLNSLKEFFSFTNSHQKYFLVRQFHKTFIYFV